MKEQIKTNKKRWIKPELQVLAINFAGGTKTDGYYNQTS
jgi:hypothetical protein